MKKESFLRKPAFAIILLVVSATILIYSKTSFSSKREEFLRQGRFEKVQDGDTIMGIAEVFAYGAGAAGLILLVISLNKKRNE